MMDESGPFSFCLVETFFYVLSLLFFHIEKLIQALSSFFIPFLYHSVWPENVLPSS
jgi:hypothetical protein